MLKDSEPQIDPDDSVERAIGIEYSRDMHYFHQGLSTLQRLPDDTIRTGAGLMKPNGEYYGMAFVPKDYIPEHMLKTVSPPYLQAIVPDQDPDKLAAIYLKYLLHEESLSTKSKLAQSGWKILAEFGTKAYLNFDIYNNQQGFYFWMLIRNLNPRVTFQTPNTPFPAFRFYLPSNHLTGLELLEQTKLMKNLGIVLEDGEDTLYQPHELEGLKPTDPLLFGTKRQRVSSIIVPIEREAEFSEEKTVSVQELLDCPSTDRQALDKIWGLRWKKPGETPNFEYLEQVLISESNPLVMPSGIAAVIDHNQNWLDTLKNGRDSYHGIFQHEVSPLIDPGFGLPNGQPIRFEHHAVNIVAQTPRVVRMRLHKSN